MWTDMMFCVVGRRPSHLIRWSEEKTMVSLALKPTARFSRENTWGRNDYLPTYIKQQYRWGFLPLARSIRIYLICQHFSPKLCIYTSGRLHRQMLLACGHC